MKGNLEKTPLNSDNSNTTISIHLINMDETKYIPLFRLIIPFPLMAKH